MKVIPENILRCMSAKDRQSVRQRTVSEVMANGVAKSEKQLQRQIISLLRLKGIEPLVPAFGKKTRISEGWPDITFAIYALAPQSVSVGVSDILPKAWQTFACVWEVKLPPNKLTPRQEAMSKTLARTPNGWRHRVICSIDEALAELALIGISETSTNPRSASLKVEDAPRTGEIAGAPPACASVS